MPIGARFRRGRPPQELDWALVEELLASGCTDVQVAAGLGVHPNTLVRGRNRSNYCDLKRHIHAGHSLRLRQMLIGFATGFVQPMLDEEGNVVRDDDGNPRTITVLPSEQIQWEALKFLSMQKEYLGFHD